MSAAAVLRWARRAGVALWREGNLLRWRATAKPTPELLAALREHKAKLLEALTVASSQTKPVAPSAAIDAEFEERCNVLLDDAGLPALPCASCGGGSFHKAPEQSWHCSHCVLTPKDVGPGWTFCAVPGGKCAPPVLAYPPGWQGWPDECHRACQLPDRSLAPVG